MGTHIARRAPRRTARRLIAGAATLVAVGAGSLAATPPATSQPPALRPLVSLVPHVQAVRTYWTRARMLSATPIGATTRPAHTAPRTSARAVPSGTSGVPVPRTVGKLFFTDGRADYVCSASAIATHSRNQVLTAGHCVHTGPRPDDSLLGGLLGGLLGPRPHYYSNWMFVPRYHGGVAPYGKWVAAKGYVAAGWAQNEDFTQDQGILTMAPLHGHRLIDAIGGNKVALGRAALHHGARVWGWPAAAPYSGQVAYRCDGTTVRSDVDAPRDAMIHCPMNGGSSGGPWMLRGHRTRNAGTIFAVTSRASTGGTPMLLAHPLPLSLRSLIRAAGG